VIFITDPTHLKYISQGSVKWGLRCAETLCFNFAAENVSESIVKTGQLYLILIWHNYGKNVMAVAYFLASLYIAFKRTLCVFVGGVEWNSTVVLLKQLCKRY